MAALSTDGWKLLFSVSKCQGHCLTEHLGILFLQRGRNSKIRIRLLAYTALLKACFWKTHLAGLFSCTLGFCLLDFFFLWSVMDYGLFKGLVVEVDDSKYVNMLWSIKTGIWQYRWLGFIIWRNNNSKSAAVTLTLKPCAPLISEHSQWNITWIFEHIRLQQCTGVVPNYFSFLPLATKE